MQIYLVGGAVRDQILGFTPQERDWVVVGATPEEMHAKGFIPVGKDFPVFLHPETKEEYALARSERKTGPGYKGFQFQTDVKVSLEEDLKRRDLTINAIAKDDHGNLIDPFGGQHDLNTKILRHVSDAFIEDPVRILRLARFYARFYHLGFTVAPETMELMREMVRNGEVNHLVAERVWQETERALSEKSPGQFFLALRECGALAVLFPEVDALFGVPQSPKWHPEIDTGVHNMMVMEKITELSPEPRLRFAALAHDFGKALTPKDLWPKHDGHEETGVSVLQQLCKRLRVPKDFQSLATIAVRYHGLIHNALELPAEKIVDVLEKCDAFRRPERFEELLLVCLADARGRTDFENDPYPQREFFQRAYQIAAGVDIKPLLAKGLSGEELKYALQQARIAALSEFVLP